MLTQPLRRSLEVLRRSIFPSRSRLRWIGLGLGLLVLGFTTWVAVAQIRSQLLESAVSSAAHSPFAEPAGGIAPARYFGEE